MKTMEEMHPVCRNGAIVKITVPHFSCANAFRNPTHLPGSRVEESSIFKAITGCRRITGEL